MLKKLWLMLGVIFGTIFSFSMVAMAAEEGAAAALPPEVKMWIAIAAGFGMAIATVGGAISQSRGIVSALDGIARNPSASGQMVTPMIIGLALIESLVIYTLVIELLLVFKL
jgi:F-type H+-transporting ATPase subunit c